MYYIVLPCNTVVEIYTGRVEWSPLPSHFEYAPRALLRLEKKMGQADRQTDD